MGIRIHPTAEVSDKAEIGEGSSVWHQAQVREGVKIGTNSIIGKGVYVDAGVPIGNNVKIQNYVSVYHGVAIEDGVFVGPHVCFTNDMRPRAVNPDGSLKAADDWELSETRIKKGAGSQLHDSMRDNNRRVGNGRFGKRGDEGYPRARIGIRQPGAPARIRLRVRRGV